MSHTITIENGTASFACTEPNDAPCYVYPGCDCEALTHPAHANHPDVQHDMCVLAGWFRHPDDIAVMFIDENDESGNPDKMPKNATGEIEIEWSECPLWRFRDAGLSSTAELAAAGGQL